MGKLKKKSKKVTALFGFMLLVCVNIFFIAGCSVRNKKTQELSALEKLSIRYEPVSGIGPEKGVVRRDPSDVIFVDDLFYIWYTKVVEGDFLYPEGYQGAIWYATSPDGINWTEQGEALGKEEDGSFDDFGVYTPNIMYSPYTQKYYLYYTGVPKDPKDSTRFIAGGCIGVASAESPDGGLDGWKRSNKGQPVLRTLEQRTQGKFGGTHVDDAVLVMRNEKCYMYHKGLPSADESEKLGLPKGTTPMGLAIGTQPDEVFTPRLLDSIQGFLIQAGHEVLVWEHGEGLAALPAGHYRPKTKNDFTVHYSVDGIHFNPVGGKVPNIDKLRAPGLYRPALVKPDADRPEPQWGICMTSYGTDAGLQRFIFEYVE